MADIFISYSRRDRTFVRMLYDSLVQAGRSVWVDWRDIPPTAEWLGEIFRAIQASDAFVFVITPSSAGSEICGQELAEALRQHKRIVPILRQAVDPGTLPDPLPRLNWIPFQETDDAGEALRVLLTALDIDLDFVRTHTRLLMRALDWDSHARDNSFTLRGRDLNAAERWLDGREGKDPAPTALHTEYIVASRRVETRRRRTRLIAVATTLVVTVLLAGAVWYQRQRATTRRFVSIAQALAAAARTELQQSRNDERAALLARQAYLFNERYSGGQLAEIDATLRLVLGAANPAVELGPIPGQGELNVVAYSRTGRWIAAGGDSEEVHLWDLDRPKLPARTFARKSGAISALAFSPSEDLLATATAHGEVQLWNVDTGRERTATVAGTLGNRITGVAFDGQGQTLATGTFDGSVYFISLKTDPPSVRRCCRAAGPVGSIGFLPGSAAIALSTRERIEIRDALTGQVTGTLRPERSGDIQTMAISPASGRIAAGLAQRTRVSLLDAVMQERQPDVTVKPGSVVVWDANRSGQQVLEGHESTIAGLTFLDDDRLASAGGTDGSVRLWALGGRPVASPLEPRLQDASAVASHSLRSSVAAIDSVRRVVRVWNLKPPPGAPREFRGHFGGVVGLSFAPAGTMVAAATTDDGTVAVWDLATGREHFPFGPRPSAGTAVAFSPDGRRFASGSRPDDSVIGSVRMWDITGPSTPSNTVAVHASPVTTIEFDPRGELLVTAGNLDRQLTLLDIRQQPPSSRLVGGGPVNVQTARFGVGGTYLAWSDATPIVKVWNRDRAEQDPRRFECGAAPVSALAFSRNAGWLAAGRPDRHVCLWDIGSSAASTIDAGEPVTSLALDDAGRQLAAGSASGVVRLWDLQHLEWAPRALKGFTSSVTALMFSPDGRQLAGGSDSNDQPVLLWPSTALLAEAVCAQYHRPLTADEWQRFVGADVPHEPTCQGP